MKAYDKKNAIYKYGKDEYTFDFYTSLTASDKARFVNNVTYLLVGDNYNLVLKDILFDLYVIKAFTNVDVSKILKSVTMVDDAEKFLDETNIVEIVKANAEDGVMDELENALALNIEYKTGIHRNVISDSIANLVNTLERKVSDFTIDSDSVMEMMDVLNGISGELTMDKMLDAYARSDMYKQNREEAENKDGKRKIIADSINDGNAPSSVLSPKYEV